MNEEWRDVQNYEGLYQVSDKGRIKQLNRYIKGKNNSTYLHKERILKPSLSNKKRPYKQVILTKEKKRKSFKIHVLVAISFLNYIPNGKNDFVVDHIDNNPLNNHLENLQIISQKENMRKEKKHLGICINNKNKNKYQVWWNLGGKYIYFGIYNTIIEADLYLKLVMKYEKNFINIKQFRKLINENYD